MSYVLGLLEQLNTRRGQEFAQRQQEEAKNQELETAMLMQLAQGDDDELASLAGAGLLERIAGGGKIERAKGLQGFLGEASRSSFMPMVKNLLATRGGAAQPAGSPTEVGGPRMAGAPPAAPGGAAPRRLGPPPEMPGVSQAGLGIAPEMDRASQGGLGLTPEMPGASQAALGVAGGGDGTLAPPPMQLPPPPEMPQQKYQRLYPSAAQTAANTQRAEILAKYQTLVGVLQSQGATPEETRNAVMGSMGAPVRQAQPQQVWVEYLGPDGQPTTGAGLISEGRVYVDGLPVTPLRQPTVIAANRGAGGYNVKVQGPDGNLIVQRYEGGNLVNAVPTNMPPPPAPSEFGGTTTVMVDGKPTVVQAPKARGEQPNIIGPAPPRRTGSGSQSPTRTPAALKAQGYLDEIKRRIKADTDAGKGGTDFMRNRPKPLSPSQEQAIVREVTQGEYADINSVTQASKGQALPQPPAPPARNSGPSGAAGFGSPAGADAIRAALERRRAAGR